LGVNFPQNKIIKKGGSLLPRIGEQRLQTLLKIMLAGLPGEKKKQVTGRS
jgi:hypothetical protein